MILEYFDGILLSGGENLIWPKNDPDKETTSTSDENPIAAFLSIAIFLTDLAGKLHSNGIIHQQIHPENIVWNSKTRPRDDYRLFKCQKICTPP